jgi:aspartate 1-decarboxylase
MQLRIVCKAKIHRATVTHTDVNYVGSIGIDSDLLRRTDIIPGERVCVWNVTNGERIETYAVPAPVGSGRIVINGAAARKFQPNDIVIVAAFLLTDEPIVPKMIAVDGHNAFIGSLVDNQPDVVLDAELPALTAASRA